MNNFFENVPYNHLSYPIYIKKETFYAENSSSSHINWHNDIEFVSVLSGSINYSINGEIITLTKGQGLFINANQIHYNFSSDVDCEFICVIFHPSLLCGQKNYEKKYVLPIISNKNIPYLILNNNVLWENDTINHIQNIYNISTDKDFELLFHSEFFSMWCNIYKNLCNLKSTYLNYSTITAFKKMLSFIQLHYKEKISLDDICLNGNVCKTTCNKIFKTYSGLTPVEYLTEHRLKKAIELMNSPNMTLMQICYECGFSGASYFAETFKKYYGISPKKYMHNLSEN